MEMTEFTAIQTAIDDKLIEPVAEEEIKEKPVEEQPEQINIQNPGVAIKQKPVGKSIKKKKIKNEPKKKFPNVRKIQKPIVKKKTETKSDMIRSLVDKGMTVSAISKKLGVHYSFAHAVVLKHSFGKKK